MLLRNHAAKSCTKGTSYFRVGDFRRKQQVTFLGNLVWLCGAISSGGGVNRGHQTYRRFTAEGYSVLRRTKSSTPPVLLLHRGQRFLVLHRLRVFIGTVNTP